MKDADIEINIDELRLVGFKGHQQHEIVEALKTELIRLIKSNGIPQGMGNSIQLDKVSGGTINMSPTTKPSAVGYHAARAVYNNFRVGWR